MNRRTLVLGTGLFAAMGVSAKSLAIDASLPMKAADIDPAFEKAFNAGDVPALMPIVGARMKFNPDGTQHPVGSWFAIADSVNRGARSGIKNARNWWSDGAGNLSATTSSHSKARRAAPAEISKIPIELARHIAQCFKPGENERSAA
jgi:hypothetical protein